MSLFGTLDGHSQKILDDLGTIIRRVRPLNSRQQQQLPLEIKKLFHRLADERSTRRMGYLNEPAALTAYAHYYYWWNLVRLTRLFAGLDAESFCIPENGVCLDIGSGPLTVPAALWLSHPELRARKMTWFCLDRSRTALSLGEELYLAIAARTMTGTPWTIVRVQGEAGIPLRKKAHFVVAANVFNEIMQTANRPSEQLAHSAAAMLASYTIGDNISAAASPAAVLLVEPGVPPSARFLSLVRDALIQKSWHIQAPCPHNAVCPMDGKRGGKWCHFTFSTETAPKPLRDLSDSVGLPKDHAALSFLLATSAPPCARSFQEKLRDEFGAASMPRGVESLQIRVASDPILLPGNRTGFYGCSKLGLTLLEYATGAVPREVCSGALVSVPMPDKAPPIDGKSGAVRVVMRSVS